MRPSSPGLASVFITIFTGFFFVAVVLMAPEFAFAQSSSAQSAGTSSGRPAVVGSTQPAPAGEHHRDPGQGSAGACSCPGNQQQPLDRGEKDKLWPKPSLADLKSTLDHTDAIAALEALQLALTEVGDGATYIWHRRHGRLSGAIQPTSSFKDATGQVCRHLVVALTSGSYSRKAEGIACRLPTGVWTLDG